ncbi:MAG: sugar transferase [Candidatus Omnitrophica bacterium]|nr:sugar transferase [Candidatus Omnitrophota bacterium]MCB9747010.1 sugar transferase [Candidatus Omnitrophota bacterium]
MLKEHATVFRRLLIFTDICLLTGAFFLGYFVRSFLELAYSLNAYLWMLPVYLLTWGGLLYFSGMYSSFRLKRKTEILIIIGRSALLGFITLTSFNYLFKVMYISRLLIFLIFFFGMILLAVEKIILIQYFRHLRKSGFNFRNIIIVGSGRRAQKFITRIDQHREFGLKIIGLIDDDPEKLNQQVCGHQVIGVLKDLPEILRSNVIDQVIFIVPHSWLGRCEEPILYCETVGVRVSIAVDYFDLKFSRAKQSDLHGFPLLTFDSTPDKLWQLLAKRLIDIGIAFLSLIVLAPLFLMTALLIKWTSKGPVFFTQERTGLNGRIFNLYKFRTMVQDAEQLKEKLMAHNEMEGPVFKMTNDPRITPVGKFLRKFSIDELPQLWNVLIGDMSLVGPRPPIVKEVEKYDHWQRRRLSMRPGLTCIWQVGGRNKITSFDEWMKLDLEYIDNWKLSLDLKLILFTIPVVLFGHGAK